MSKTERRFAAGWLRRQAEIQAPFCAPVQNPLDHLHLCMVDVPTHDACTQAAGRGENRCMHVPRERMRRGRRFRRPLTVVAERLRLQRHCGLIVVYHPLRELRLVVHGVRERPVRQPRRPPRELDRLIYSLINSVQGALGGVAEVAAEVHEVVASAARVVGRVQSGEMSDRRAGRAGEKSNETWRRGNPKARLSPWRTRRRLPSTVVCTHSCWILMLSPSSSTVPLGPQVRGCEQQLAGPSSHGAVVQNKKKLRSSGSRTTPAAGSCTPRRGCPGCK